MDEKGALYTPIQSGSVVKLILNKIEEALVNKELKPGDFLPSESELVKSLHVGKSSIREAVKMLEAMGIVEIKRGNGTVIRQSSSADSINPLIFALLAEQGNNADIFDLRAMFEPAYTIMAMHRAADEDIGLIEDTITKFEKDISEELHSVENDLAFHYAILESTHNPYVIKIGRVILQMFKSSIKKAVRKIPQTSIKDHREIFKAFCEKNEDALLHAIRKSFDGWKEQFED